MLNQPALVVHHEGFEDFTVWIEPTDEDVHMGLCIGWGKTKLAAISDANHNFVQLQMQLVGLMGTNVPLTGFSGFLFKVLMRFRKFRKGARL